MKLSDEERHRLIELVSKGKSPAKQQLKARILLKADASEAGEGWSDSKIMDGFDASTSMVYRVRQQFVEEGFEAVLSRKVRALPPVPKIFDGEKEAKLIALACLAAPAGRASWTLELLAGQAVLLKIVESTSPSTVARTLKKTFSNRISKSNGFIPPDANAGFVAAMENVLEVYQRPRDPDCPLVCLDESSKQLIAETRVPVTMKPGGNARYDYEYERNGTANLFMMFAPLEGWRNVKVTDRHTAIDYAHALKDLADVHFPEPRRSSSSRII